MITADTITDEQIRELRRARKIDAQTYMTAIWGSWLQLDARARCAAILNAHAKESR